MSLKICIVSVSTEDVKMLNSSTALWSVILQLCGVSYYIFYFELTTFEQMVEENNVLNSPTNSGLQYCFMTRPLWSFGKTSLASL